MTLSKPHDTDNKSIKSEILNAIQKFSTHIQPAGNWLRIEISKAQITKPDFSARDYIRGLQEELEEIERVTQHGKQMIEQASERDLVSVLHKVKNSSPLNKYQSLNWSSRIFVTTFVNELERSG